MMGRCNKCRFAVRGEENETHLYCHRNPPAMIAVAAGISFPFPAVATSGWCGEFRLALKRLFRGHVETRA